MSQILISIVLLLMNLLLSVQVTKNLNDIKYKTLILMKVKVFSDHTKLRVYIQTFSCV